MTPEKGGGAQVANLVRYEDEELAVVNKPAGMVVHGPGHCLVEALQRCMALAPQGGPERPGIVHRLDKDTSGLLVVAKTDRALQALLEAMKDRSISRTYLCLAAGSFSLPQGRIEAPVGRSLKSPTRMSVSGGGKPAATEFKVLERLRTSSFLEVKLETGRTHQIRVHLAHIKHPVVGDYVYGPGTAKLARDIELRRPFLHATRLEFRHPLTGEEVAVSEPLPSELESALRLARRG